MMANDQHDAPETPSAASDLPYEHLSIPGSGYCWQQWAISPA